MMWAVLRLDILRCSGLHFPGLVGTCVLLSFLLSERAAAQLVAGLQAEFRAASGADQLVIERPALFVPGGMPPTPLLPPGDFTVSWRGFLSSELRSDYLLKAEFAGKMDLEINGRSVLSGAGSNQVLLTPKAVRLNKGTNSFLMKYESVRGGDSYLRLFWGEKEFLLQPIAPGVLSHSVTPDEIISLDRHRGRDRFAELRCSRCHADSALQAGMPELTMDAPSLEGIGSRRRFEWLERWLSDPQSIRAHARMPRLLFGPGAAEQTRAVAAYLSSLKQPAVGTIPPASSPLPASDPQGPAGESIALAPLYERLQCSACHTLQAGASGAGELISLADVSQKFPPGELEAYLLKPEAHDRWSRMPNFHLSQPEAAELASFLIGTAKRSEERSGAVKPEWVTRGRELVTSTGCLNCHPLPLANEYVAPPLAKLKRQDWTRGCLATNAAGRGRAPEFSLSESDRRSLRELGRTDLASLGQDTAAAFSLRQSAQLRCGACHGPMAGIPAFDILGGKLQPEWAAAFIAGKIPYKPRAERHPKGEIWMPARMPAFPAYATGIAQGLALSHGVALRTAPEADPDPELARIGRQLLGKDSGFSCVSCHAVGKVPALEVFESEGINLAYSGRRLQRSFFERWMASPISIDPQTKMPAYFDEEGQSQLGDILEGQASKQIHAMWQYLRLGEAMEPPVVPAANP